MIDDKVLLVTGASSDVGIRLINRIGENYCKIWTHYRGSSDMFSSLKGELGGIITPIQADFSNEDSVRSLIGEIKESGYIPDHIVHISAPKAHNLQFHKYTWEDFQSELNVSLRSIMMILHCFIPYMTRNDYGRVVFMLSAGLFGIPPKYQSPYITAKYALYGLMRNLAAEYAGRGITVNAVSPDMMETKFLSELPKIIKEKSAKDNPLGRNIVIDEVIPAIEFFLLNCSDAVTGQNIGITGGVR